LIPSGDDWPTSKIDLLRVRSFTLHDFVTRGCPYFADDFPMEPAALKNLDKACVRPGLRQFAERLAADAEFTEASVERDLRALAEELGLKAGGLINDARAALTGQAVGPSAFHVFKAIGRDRAITRLRTV
jgi:glutamyl/glutaminyl-tRNA synthetase